MKKVLLGIAVTTIAIMASASPASATANGNFGSIVKVSDSCANMGEVASNNFGSIVKIDGGGTCDIEDIMKSPAVKDNFGSIIKISNVCGNTDGVANNNFGSIVKIDSNGPCKKDEPTTVVVTPEEPEEEVTHEEETPIADAPKDETPKEDKGGKDAPAEIPSTGPASAIAGLFGTSALGYGVQAWMTSRRKLAAALNQ